MAIEFPISTIAARHEFVMISHLYFSTNVGTLSGNPTTRKASEVPKRSRESAHMRSVYQI